MGKGNFNDRTLEHIQGRGTYSTNMQIAAELLALPSRGGFTLQEIAERAEVSDRQLRNWRNDPRFQALVEQKTRNNVKEVMPDVMDSIVKRAIEGSAKHAELLLKYQGLMTEVHQHELIQDTSSRPDLSQYDRMNDEIEQEIAALKRELEEEGEVVDADFEELEK